MNKKISQLDLLLEYFRNHPNQDVPHSTIVDWATAEYFKRTKKIFRDPDRGIRSLYEKGCLKKIRKGVYRFNPNDTNQRTPEDFTASQKKAILIRDNYQCVLCGKGKNEGMELHVDHIKPKDLGGKATIGNGQVLCSQHNFLKKNLNQTETGKKMFIRLYELAKQEREELNQKFCLDILEVFDKHGVNGHIKWKK